MANKIKNPKTAKKFWLSLQLPLEYKSLFEQIAERENRTVKAQATHILTIEIERQAQQQQVELSQAA